MKKMSRTWVLASALLVMAPGLAMAKDETEAVAQALSQRLVALQANPATTDAARFEQLQAQQAIANYREAKRSEREGMLQLAQRRVEIAEVSAATAVIKQQLEQVENTRSELLIEASRREAARARQEAERLRMQAQMQAEESEQLRQQAEADLLARQDAEAALSSVASKRAAQVTSAQRQAAQLAHEEAELTSGQTLPPSKFESRGEVFTLPAAAFAGSGATLSEQGNNQIKALVDYLNIGRKGRVGLVGYGSSASARADAVRDALVAAGISSNRLQTAAGKGSSASRSLEVVVHL